MAVGVVVAVVVAVAVGVVMSAPQRFLLPVQAMQLLPETCAAIHEWVGDEHDHDGECGGFVLVLADGRDLAPGEWLVTDGTRWWVTAEQPGVTDDEAFREHWLAEMARATPEGGAS